MVPVSVNVFARFRLALRGPEAPLPATRTLPRSIRIAETTGEIADRPGQVEAGRDDLFQDRHDVAAVVRDWSLEGWLREVAGLAAGLAARATGRRRSE